MYNDDRRRIQRVSRHFRLLFTALIFCIPALDFLYWAFFNHLPNGFIELPAAVATNQTLPYSSLALAFCVSLIPVSVAMFGMVTLTKLFKLYENAIVFAAENVKYVRRLGYILIYWVIASAIFTTLISIVISFANPPGQRMMVAEFQISDLSTLLIGAIVILISWIMEEGRKLEDETAHTI